MLEKRFSNTILLHLVFKGGIPATTHKSFFLKNDDLSQIRKRITLMQIAENVGR